MGRTQKVGSISQHKNGYRAQVGKLGIRKSKVFATKRAAQDWITKTEFAIASGDTAQGKNIPLQDLFDRYETTITPRKRGAGWEKKQFVRLHKDPLAKLKLMKVSKAEIHDYIDRRLLTVQGSTINRELNLISNVFSYGIQWGLISENPCSGIKRPKDNPPRERRITDAEIEALTVCSGFSDGSVGTISQRVMAAFLFAIETGMRAGEICSLSPNSFSGRVARLEKTKNGFARDVPLSKRAIELAGFVGNDFKLNSRQLDANFRKLRDRAMISDLHFHDSRHEAVTRLAKKVHVLALAKMIGHRDLRQLQTYYDESAEDIANHL